MATGIGYISATKMAVVFYTNSFDYFDITSASHSLTQNFAGIKFGMTSRMTSNGATYLHFALGS